MKVRKWATALSLSLAWVCPSTSPSDAAPASGTSGSLEVVISGNGDLDLAPTAVVDLKSLALAGSGPAAHRLARYYFFAKEDLEAGMYWETIGAENGYSPAMFNLATRLIIANNRDDDQRAHFWLRRARAAGYPVSRISTRLQEMVSPGRPAGR